MGKCKLVKLNISKNNLNILKCLNQQVILVCQHTLTNPHLVHVNSITYWYLYVDAHKVPICPCLYLYTAFIYTLVLVCGFTHTPHTKSLFGPCAFVHTPTPSPCLVPDCLTHTGPHLYFLCLLHTHTGVPSWSMSYHYILVLVCQHTPHTKSLFGPCAFVHTPTPSPCLVPDCLTHTGPHLYFLCLLHTHTGVPSWSMSYHYILVLVCQHTPDHTQIGTHLHNDPSWLRHTLIHT